MPPSIANPTTKLRMPETVNTLLRNNLIGSIGSAARCSTNTKATSSTTDPAAIHRIVGDVHGYSVPPQLVTSVSPVAASAINAIPA